MAFRPGDSAGDSTASRTSDSTPDFQTSLGDKESRDVLNAGRPDNNAADESVKKAGFASARDLLPESADSKAGDSGQRNSERSEQTQSKSEQGDALASNLNKGDSVNDGGDKAPSKPGATTEKFDGLDKATSLKMENGGERTFGRNENGDLKNVKMEDGQEWKKNEKTGRWRSITEKSNGAAAVEVENARDVSVGKDGTVDIQLDRNLWRQHRPDGSATLDNKENGTKIDFKDGSPTEVRNSETGTKYEYQRDKDGGLNDIKQDGKSLYHKDGDNWMDANGGKLSGEPSLNEYTGKVTAKYPDGKNISHESDGSRIENRPTENGSVTEADFKRPQDIAMDKLGGGEQIMKGVTSLHQTSDRDTGSRSTFKTGDGKETTVETAPDGRAYSNKGLEMGRNSFGGLNNIRKDGETLYQKRGSEWFDKDGNQMDSQSAPQDFDRIKRVDVHPDKNTYEKYHYDGSTEKTIVNDKGDVQSNQMRFTTPRDFAGTTDKGEKYQIDGATSLDLSRDGDGFKASVQAGKDAYEFKMNAAGKAIGKPVRRQPARTR